MSDLPISPYAEHYETAGLDEAWQQGFKAGRAEWEATIKNNPVIDMGDDPLRFQLQK